jgi:hypothetical protein
MALSYGILTLFIIVAFGRERQLLEECAKIALLPVEARREREFTAHSNLVYDY